VYSSSTKRFKSYSGEDLHIQVQPAPQWLPYFNILGKNYFIRELSDLYLFFGVPVKDAEKLDQLEIWLELDPSFFISSDYVSLTRPLLKKFLSVHRVSSEDLSEARYPFRFKKNTPESKSEESQSSK
jgi:hypothetical protein